MKTLNHHHNSMKGRSKEDYHFKRLFDNSKEPISNFATKIGMNRLKPVQRYYKVNQYRNWWEGVGYKGNGKLIQELDNEISIGIEEYEIQQQEDLEDYNKLIMEGIR